MQRAATNIHLTGTILNHKSNMVLAYADDLDIIGLRDRDVSRAFCSIEKESKRMGLAVNQDKTKYLLSTTGDTRRIGNSVTMIGNDQTEYKFGVVKDFIYLGTSINDQNDVSLEIKRRITLANRCYYGLSKQFSSRAFSRRTKITLYKSLILPVLLYGAEAWTLRTTEKQMLGAFERKILRRIFGPLRVDGEYRRRTNLELYELYVDVDLVKKIQIERLRWLGHVERMENNAPAKKVLFDGTSHGHRSRGRQITRWKDQVVQDLNSLGVFNWRQQARDRNNWRRLLTKAKIEQRL